MTKKIRRKRILTRVLVAETLELMKLIERTQECGDCLLWTGATTKQGYPQYKPYGCACTSVRRTVFEIMGGALEARKPIEMTCGEKTCINPKHMRKSTCALIGQKAAKKGGWKGLARASKIASAKRAKNAKLTIEQARDIRMSTESGTTLAALYGVDRSLINGIKAGTRWRDYTNPFSGLMS